MEKPLKIVFLSTLILAVALAPGCIGEVEEGPIYPDAEEIEMPSEVSEEILEEIEWDGLVNAYKTTDSPEEVMDWYEVEMENQQWSELHEDFGIAFWEKDNNIFGVQTIEPEEAEQEFDVNKTVIITISVPPLEL